MSLQIVSQIARNNELNFPKLLSVFKNPNKLSWLLTAHLARDYPVVTSKACNFIGNLCRHSDVFYTVLLRPLSAHANCPTHSFKHLLHLLLNCCSIDGSNRDVNIRKFACFAGKSVGWLNPFLFPFLFIIVLITFFLSFWVSVHYSWKRGVLLECTVLGHVGFPVTGSSCWFVKSQSPKESHQQCRCDLAILWTAAVPGRTIYGRHTRRCCSGGGEDALQRGRGDRQPGTQWGWPLP